MRGACAAAFGLLYLVASCARAHPLDALTPDELNHAVQILHEAKLADRTARFGIVRLQ
jgi:Cu2+-containing amine oxidase